MVLPNSLTLAKSVEPPILRRAHAEPFVEALTVKLEGKTQRLKNPHTKGSLARLAWVVGRLGGWDGYEGHGYKPAEIGRAHV